MFNWLCTHPLLRVLMSIGSHTGQYAGLILKLLLTHFNKSIVIYSCSLVKQRVSPLNPPPLASQLTRKTLVIWRQVSAFCIGPSRHAWRGRNTGVPNPFSFNGAKTRMRTELCLIKPVELGDISVGQSFHVWIPRGGLHHFGPPGSPLQISFLSRMNLSKMMFTFWRRHWNP